MNLYRHSNYIVDDVLSAAHTHCRDALGTTGTWWTGAERADLVADIRAARVAAGVAEPHGDAAASGSEVASGIASEVARAVALRPHALDLDFYRAARAAGLGEEEYVETVAVAALTCDLDIFARGLGIAPLRVRTVETGEPTRTRPASARAEGAWVDTVPAGRRGGDDSKALYGDAMMPFIIRALSLVPAETRVHLDTEQAQYLPLQHFADFGYQHHAGLSRAQVEVVAGRVSALNECFY